MYSIDRPPTSGDADASRVAAVSSDVSQRASSQRGRVSHVARPRRLFRRLVAFALLPFALVRVVPPFAAALPHRLFPRLLVDVAPQLLARRDRLRQPRLELGDVPERERQPRSHALVLRLPAEESRGAQLCVVPSGACVVVVVVVARGSSGMDGATRRSWSSPASRRAGQSGSGAPAVSAPAAGRGASIDAERPAVPCDPAAGPRATHARMTIAATAAMAAGRKNLVAGPRDRTSARQSSSRGAGAEISREKIPPGASVSARFSPAILGSSSPGRRAFAVEPRLTAASRATRSDAAREAPAVRDSSASLSHWSPRRVVVVVAHARTRSLLVRGGVPGRKPGDAPASRSSKSSATLELELESTRAGPAENGSGSRARPGRTRVVARHTFRCFCEETRGARARRRNRARTEGSAPPSRRGCPCCLPCENPTRPRASGRTSRSRALFSLLSRYRVVAFFLQATDA